MTDKHALTRRNFNAAATAAVSLTLLGCDSENNDAGTNRDDTPGVSKRSKGRLATQPFSAGSLDQYRSSGVYTQLWEDYDVYLVNSDGILVALAALCTHNFCTTHWHDEAGHFICPCHKNRFDRQGHPAEDAKAKRPLDRCAIRIIESGKEKQIQIDPTKRYREDKDEWGAPNCFVKL